MGLTLGEDVLTERLGRLGLSVWVVSDRIRDRGGCVMGKHDVRVSSVDSRLGFLGSNAFLVKKVPARNTITLIDRLGTSKGEEGDPVPLPARIAREVDNVLRDGP